MLPPSSREFQGNRSCRVTYRSPIYRYQPTIGGSRLTPELTGPPHSIGIHANNYSAAPVQRVPFGEPSHLKKSAYGFRVMRKRCGQDLDGNLTVEPRIEDAPEFANHT